MDWLNQVFIERFFEKYQTQLLYLANNPIGKFYLGIKDPREIVKLTNNSFHVYLGKKQYKATFKTYPVYAKKLALLLRAGLLVPFVFKPQLAPLFALVT